MSSLPNAAAPAELTLFDFILPGETHHWVPSNDDVMGGDSRSALLPDLDSVALFAGVVSLENNGGFASVRSRNTRYDLSSYDGIMLRLRGDGKVYGFYLRSHMLFRQGIRYQALFHMIPVNTWQSVRIPFAALEPMVFGMRLPIAPGFDSGDVASFGFIIGDKQAGPFRLEIDWLKAYRDA